MTDISELYNDPCKKLDALCVDAFFDLSLDEFKPTDLVLDTSWGETTVDLTPAIKAGETITHLLLTDTALQFNREDYGREDAENGGIDCIKGDDLSHIISMKYLRDAAQPPSLTNGDVYMWNNNSQLFKLFNLQDFVNDTNASLNELESRITDAENQISQINTKLNNFITTTNQALDTINNRLDAIESAIARPAGIPDDTVIAWGNRNYYSDYTNTDQRTTGIFTHSTAQTLANDTKDA